MNNLYRKLSVVVEAKRLLDHTMWEVNAWIDKEGGKTGEWSWDEDEKYITIETPEGNHKATVGDWIIKGVHGEFYPCKPEIFAKTYEHASAPTPPVATGEAEKLRKDAERYRWLTGEIGCYTPHPYQVLNDMESKKEDVDAAIDAAMKEKP